MPHSFGYRGRTRDMFKKNFKDHGMIPTSTFLKTYKLGDIVDIKNNATEHRGMTHKYYQGRTGRLVNIAPSAVTVQIFKVVGNRYIEKRVNVRVEHVRHSKCREEFIRRVKENAQKKKDAKEQGTQISVKRLPVAPREASHIKVSSENAIQTLTALPYDTYI